MKERPILFSTPMVKAILDGRKTVTRRVIKPQPYLEGRHICQSGINYGQTISGAPNLENFVKCVSPYGQPGDILWVRETWRPTLKGSDTPTGYWNMFDFKAGGEKLASLAYERKFDELRMDGKWRPSIHMPKEACRLKLEVLSIRPERLHDITLSEVMREGVEVRQFSLFGLDEDGRNKVGRIHFQNLWESINGPGSWNHNLWVWRIEFTVLPQPPQI